jgi:hypothetical protein
MTLPKHIRERGIELIKQAAGLTGASMGMPGMLANEVKQLPDIVGLKPMGKGSPNVMKAPNMSMGVQQNFMSATAPKMPDFSPKLADFPIGSIVGDLLSEVGEQLYLRSRMKGKQPAVQPRPPKKDLRPKLADANAASGSMSDADNDNRIPYGPYRPQYPFRAAGGGQTITGPGNSVGDKVQDQFMAASKLNDTWLSNEPTNAGGATMQQGSAYNSPIKSAMSKLSAKVRSSTESRNNIDGDNVSVDHGVRIQPATYDKTEIRGGIGDSPYEGIPRMHDSMATGRGMTPEDVVTKSFDSLKTPIDTSTLENSNVNSLQGPTV